MFFVSYFPGESYSCSSCCEYNSWSLSIGKSSSCEIIIVNPESIFTLNLLLGSILVFTIFIQGDSKPLTLGLITALLSLLTDVYLSFYSWRGVSVVIAVSGA